MTDRVADQKVCSFVRSFQKYVLYGGSWPLSFQSSVRRASIPFVETSLRTAWVGHVYFVAC